MSRNTLRNVILIILPLLLILRASESARAQEDTPAPAAVDPFEPNDTLESAVEVFPDQTYSDLNFTNSDDVDHFKIYLKSTQRLQVDTLVSGGADTVLTLLGPGGESIAVNDDRSGTEVGSRIVFDILTDGWYIIAANSAIPSIAGSYQLQIALLPVPTPTALPTETPLPTATIQPSPTATLLPDLPTDTLEPNDTFDTAIEIIPGQSIDGLTFSSASDKDFFKLYAKAGQIIRFETFTLGGADTKILVYNGSRDVVGSNDDRAQTDTGSTFVWQIPVEGFYFMVVESSIPIIQGSYVVQTGLEIPTPTATAGPTQTPQPTSTPAPTSTPLAPLDEGEPNNFPEEAFGIIPGETYRMSLGPIEFDTHDFYSMIGKSGVRYICSATNPQGVDPAMRAYVGDIGAGILIAENDDISSGDIGSQVEFKIEGGDTPVFIVVEARIGQGLYEFECGVKTYVAPAPAASSDFGSVPSPGSDSIDVASSTDEEPSTEAEVITPTVSIVELPFQERIIYSVPPPPTITTIELVITYDENNNRQADPAEGVPNVSIRALNGNKPVGWAVTNDTGRATLTITGDVDRITVPYLSGWNAQVRPGQFNPIDLIIPAQQLPVIMPSLEN